MKDFIINFFKESKKDPIKAIINVMKTEVFLYLLFGVLTTIVNIATYELGRRFFEINNVSVNIFSYKLEGWRLAELIAFIVAVIFAFFTNKYIVFKKTGKDCFLREILTFFGARIISEIMCILVMTFMIDIKHMDEFLAKIVTTFINVVFNYVASKLVIFKN